MKPSFCLFSGVFYVDWKDYFLRTALYFWFNEIILENSTRCFALLETNYQIIETLKMEGRQISNFKFEFTANINSLDQT